MKISWCGIRGAISVARNGETGILEATRTLLDKMHSENNIPIEQIVSMIFTVTPDLNAVYPSTSSPGDRMAATPLICAADMDVPGNLRQCISVLMHTDINRSQDSVNHVYLGKARSLRPDGAEEVST